MAIRRIDPQRDRRPVKGPWKPLEPAAALDATPPHLTAHAERVPEKGGPGKGARKKPGGRGSPRQPGSTGIAP